MMRKLFETLAAACLALALLPMAALAADGGGSPAVTTVKTGEALKTAVASGGEVKLGGDITISSTLEIGKTVTLDLNGYVLKYENADERGGVILVDEDGVLTLTDSRPDAVHKFDAASSPWTLDEAGGAKTVYGGVITGGTGKSIIEGSSSRHEGGGVFINHGAFKMEGGSIVGCQAYFGGAVSVYCEGTFEMKGGSVVGCCTNSDGAGVYVFEGTFDMTGGVISDCEVVLPLGSGGIVHGADTSLATIKNSSAGGATVCYGGSLVNKGKTEGHLVEFWDGGRLYAWELVSSGTGRAVEPAAPAGSAGYDFGGWYTEADGGSKWDFGSTVSDGMTLYARWTPHEYAIGYELNGGSFAEGKSAPTAHTYGTETSLASPEREGYTFGGWYTNAEFAGSAVRSLGATDYTGDVTLYARWTPHEYAIGYELNGGSFAEGKSAPTAHTYGTETSLASPEREGYTFGGWYTNAEFAGAAVRSLGATDYTSDVTLYAKWVSVDELDYRWYDKDAEDYVISNAAQLRGLANLVNGTDLYDDGLGRTGFEGKTVRLAADIDLAGIANWAPIGLGVGDKFFGGVFDGDGKTVSNLTVDASHGHAGLFGRTFGATVKNLSVSGTVAGSGGWVGGIVGELVIGSIENCSFSGTVCGSGAHCVGGIAGEVCNGAISGCSNFASVSGTGKGAYVGGIAGEAKCDVRYCCNRGDVGSDGDYAHVGGIAGHVYPIEEDGVMRSCYSVGAVSATGADANAGGAIGFVDDSTYRLTVDGVYYLEGSAPRGIGAIYSDEYGNPDISAGVAGDAGVASAAAFGGGEAAWLLQGAADEGDGPVWGQAIGADACPVLGGDAVCRVVFKVDGEDDLVEYVNRGGTVGVSDPAAPAGYAFAGWYTEAAGGAEFELSNAVTEDITLYARWADATATAPAEPEPLPGDGPVSAEPPTDDVLAGTGDDAHAAAWRALLLASACALIAAAARLRRFGWTR